MFMGHQVHRLGVHAFNNKEIVMGKFALFCFVKIKKKLKKKNLLTIFAFLYILQESLQNKK